MDVVEAIDRLRHAHAAAGLGHVSGPRPGVEATLSQIAAAVAPARLPADLVEFWRSVDPDSLAVAPSPRPASPGLCLRLWHERQGQFGRRDGVSGTLFPWCYESHEYGLVELAGGVGGALDGGCYEWPVSDAPAVPVFTSVAAYLDLLATMIELHEFTRHPTLGVVEFDPQRRWHDAQSVRLAGSRRRLAVVPEVTTIRELQERAESGSPATGVIRALVVTLAGCASGNRIEVTDGSGLLDLWCPSSVCLPGPLIERRFEFEVTVRPGCDSVGDVSADLTGVVRATRDGDLEEAIALAAPLYDRIFGQPAAAHATALRAL